MNKKLAILAGAVILAATAMIPATANAAICTRDSGVYKCESPL